MLVTPTSPSSCSTRRTADDVRPHCDTWDRRFANATSRGALCSRWMTGLRGVGPGATGAGRTGAEKGRCAGSVGVIGGTVGPSRGDGSVGRPTRRGTTPGLDTPARGGRWPGEPGMIGAACVRSRCRSVALRWSAPRRVHPRRADVSVPMCPGVSGRVADATGARFHRPARGGAVGRKGTVADGPLIVQSDKTLLLEVDHPPPRRPARRSLPSRSSNARPSTSTPTASPRWPCGTRGPPGTTPSRSSTRSSGSPATPSPSRCSSTSSTPWAATAACSSPSRRSTAWCSSRWTGPCSRRYCGSAGSPDARRASTPTPSSCTRPSAVI